MGFEGDASNNCHWGEQGRAGERGQGERTIGPGREESVAREVERVTSGTWEGGEREGEVIRGRLLGDGCLY